MDTNTNASKTHARQNEVTQAAALLEGAGAGVQDEPEQKLDLDVEQAETPEPAGQKVERITDESHPGADAELEVKPDQDDPQLETGDGDESKAVTLKELAENLEVETKDLYDVEIAINGDESATLGQLKDSFKEFKALKASEEESARVQIERENEHLNAKRTIDSIIEVATQSGVMSPQLLQQVESHQREKVAKERRYTLAAIPEWNDELQRTSDYDAMVKHFEQYGFSEVEIRGETDHRRLKAMRDIVKQAALSEKFHKETLKPKQIRGGQQVKKSTLRQKIQTAKQSRSQHEKLGVVSELLNS